jgi:hypothetical protein
LGLFQLGFGRVLRIFQLLQAFFGLGDGQASIGDRGFGLHGSQGRVGFQVC